MKKNAKLYVIKLNKKIILSFGITFLLLLSTIFLKNVKIIDIFNSKNKIDKIIVIDPGHGGIDGGANDKYGFLEKNINLDIGLKLKKELEKEGFSVIMTRETDKSLEELSNINASRYNRDLDARKSIINQAKPDAFISIHVNSNIQSKAARGIQIYYYPTSENSKTLAKALCYSIDKNIYNNFLKTDKLKTKIISEDYFILRETSYTGVLIEAGFMTNTMDKSLLEDENYRAKIAFSIKEGIKKYVMEKEL